MSMKIFSFKRSSHRDKMRGMLLIDKCLSRSYKKEIVMHIKFFDVIFVKAHILTMLSHILLSR